ncbi:MAG: hypothetical protein P1U88_21720 [Thalassobaculaceae bacterium]|nr:hypothetical protein [Thalassobaculaceae bacterium]
MARLVTIGDSVSQGFMSAGAAQTQQSYSTLLARMMELPNYRIPEWPHGGIPINGEALLRHLSKYYGADIWGPFEWSGAALRIRDFLDNLETYYERGQGDFLKPYASGVRSFHNLASFGFTVADAWQLTPEIALDQLLAGENKPFEDQAFATPSNAFYRSAFRVLNPSADPALNAMSQIEWLRHYAERDPDGVENVVLFLGANNALGTVLHLEVREDLTDIAAYEKADHRARMNINLSTLEQFELDYAELLDRIVDILDTDAHHAKAPGWQVFLGTVPAVTIAPIAKGFGATERVTDPFGVVADGANYYARYSYVILEQDAVMSGDPPALTRDQAIEIDTRIAGFNTIIRRLVAEMNARLDRPRLHVVDTAAALLRAAIKRNGGRPTYDFPQGLLQAFRSDEVLRRYDSGRAIVDLPGGPALIPTTKYYRAENDRVYEGGLFSLDGVHPSAIGQGILADEFAGVMRANGVHFRKRLNWPGIVRSDALSWRPLNLIEEIFQHSKLATFIFSALRTRPEKTERPQP